ncbi:hypothetical protein X975_19809, partial [Stegodyphus mimosarum]
MRKTFRKYFTNLLGQELTSIGFNEYFQQSHPVCQINCADQINKNLMDNLKFANTTITHI